MILVELIFGILIAHFCFLVLSIVYQNPFENIGPNYLHRWWLIPQWKWLRRILQFNIYIHNFRRSDNDRHLHDHPWDSYSILIWGQIEEVIRVSHKVRETRKIRKFKLIKRNASSAHAVRLVDDKPAWTIFIPLKKTREWGFWVKGYWVPAQDYSQFIRDTEGKN